MAVYDFDGYDDYATAGIPREHIQKVEDVAGYVAIVAGGRSGTNRLQCRSVGSGVANIGAVMRGLSAGPASVIIGVYTEMSALSRYFLEFRDASNSHVLIRSNSDGSLSAYRSANNGWFGSSSTVANSAVLLGTSAAGVIGEGTPFHIEVAVTIDDANGAVEITVNGTSVLDLTSQDTRNSGTATVNSIVMGNAGGSSGYVYFDDFWSASTSQGDCRVDCHYPDADGTHGDGTPSGAGNHYADVDETGEPDDDTSYVSLATASDRESYSVEAFKNDGADIKGVMIVLDCRKADAGAGTIAASIYKTATDYDGDEAGMTTNYTRVKDIWELDPSDSTAWTAAKFDACEYGYKKVV